MRVELIEAEAPRKKIDKVAAAKAMVAVLFIFFLLGLSLGACALGVMAPIALFDLATGR